MLLSRNSKDLNPIANCIKVGKLNSIKAERLLILLVIFELLYGTVYFKQIKELTPPPDPSPLGVGMAAVTRLLFSIPMFLLLVFPFPLSVLVAGGGAWTAVFPLPLSAPQLPHSSVFLLLLLHPSLLGVAVARLLLKPPFANASCWKE